MLTEQKVAFGFQDYVVPMLRPVKGKYMPYSKENISRVGKSIIHAAGLPSDLWLMDLRRTGTTQMNDAGVSMGQIMSVTGHTNPQSVKPYMKHTFSAANSALTKRQEII